MKKQEVIIFLGRDLYPRRVTTRRASSYCSSFPRSCNSTAATAAAAWPSRVWLYTTWLSSVLNTLGCTSLTVMEGCASTRLQYTIAQSSWRLVCQQWGRVDDPPCSWSCVSVRALAQNRNSFCFTMVHLCRRFCFDSACFRKIVLYMTMLMLDCYRLIKPESLLKGLHHIRIHFPSVASETQLEFHHQSTTYRYMKIRKQTCKPRMNGIKITSCDFHFWFCVRFFNKQWQLRINVKNKIW